MNSAVIYSYYPTVVVTVFLLLGRIEAASNNSGKPGDAEKVFMKFLERDLRNREMNEGQPLKLTVYYETLCSYSVTFFRDQLIPVWKALGPEYLKLQFVPYGNAHSFFKSGLILTGCQHGEKECLGNKIHACVMQYLPPDTANDFILCSMSFKDPVEAASTNCSQAYIPNSNYSEEVVLGCATGYTGELVLAVQGLMSLDFVTEGVPAVAFNGALVEDDTVLENLLLYVCVHIYQLNYKSPGFVLPAVCSKAFEDQANSTARDKGAKLGISLPQQPILNVA